MITVEIRLYADLGRHTPDLRVGEPRSVAVPAGTTVGDLLTKLGILPEVVRLVFVNGAARPLDWELRDGDRVGIFPPIGGG
ncbi:TPA: molybdopterin synthase sulfur carrier subunit [Candidatus Acetothermia bacterium]|nr:molybdopterin synthase sulfur carrier subunit [Candidatus Acetothermia bacterium]HAZ30426.1 molybdopterin synthase sulfur carrier subunit [Candidatus Acetothermia bacterium]